MIDETSCLIEGLNIDDDGMPPSVQEEMVRDPSSSLENLFVCEPLVP